MVYLCGYFLEFIKLCQNQNKMGRTKGSKNKKTVELHSLFEIEEELPIIEEGEKILEFSNNQKYLFNKYASGAGYIYQYICLTI